jgi:glycine hydroxymethyltransferase
MFVLDVYESIGVTGKETEEELDKIHITCNKNQIPNDPLPPLKSSGVRIGTPAMTTKGWKEDDFRKLSKVIIDYLKEVKEGTQEAVREDYIEKVEKIINDVKAR